MKYDFADDLISVAVKKEIVSQIKSKKLDPINLLYQHAIRMLDEIACITDQHIPCEQQIEKIVKILTFVLYHPMLTNSIY